MSGDGARPPRVGLWGTFDVDNYGDLILAHITKKELARRLPDATIRTYSPFGWFHPVGFHGVDLPEPLGVWSRERLAQIAAVNDCIVIGGGDIIHTEVAPLAHAYGIEPDEMRRRTPDRFFIEGLGPELERHRAVLWNAVGIPFDLPADEAERVRGAAEGRPYLSVRDEPSRRRLEVAGVDREIAVVPDPAVLVARMVPPSEAEVAMAFLRAMEWFPDGPALAVQGNGRLVGWVPALAESIEHLARDRELSVVTLEIGPCHGDGEFAHALHGALRGRVPLRHLPGTARLEDVAAAISGSVAFIGSSLHGAITSFAYERPYVMLGGHQSKMGGFGELTGETWIARTAAELVPTLARAESAGVSSAMVAALQRRVDAHFDRLAGIAQDAAASALPITPPPAHREDITTLGAVLVRSLETRDRRLAAERDSAAVRLREQPDSPGST